MPVPNPFPPIGPQPSGITDTWVAFAVKPQQDGMYLDGRPSYNVLVPLRGTQLEETHLGIMLPATAQEEMTTRKERFEANQTFSLITGVKWWNIGYWVDPITSEIIAYHQYQYPRYTPPQLVWSNWPNTPEDFTPPP